MRDNDYSRKLLSLAPHLVSILLGSLLLLSTLFAPGQEAHAQAPTAAPATVTVTVLDQGGQPLPDITVKLTLVVYTTGIEYRDGGSCLTDALGVCQIGVPDVPRLWDGMAEALLEVGSYGTKTINWYGDQVTLTIQVGDLGFAATVVASGGSELPYATGTLTATVPMTTTAVAIPTATATAPPTPLPAATETPSPPTPAPSETPSPTPPPTWAIPTITPTLPQRLTPRVGWLPLILGLVIFALFLVIVASRARRGGMGTRKPAQPKPTPPAAPGTPADQQTDGSEGRKPE
jgi:hypothetical protein